MPGIARTVPRPLVARHRSARRSPTPEGSHPRRALAAAAVAGLVLAWAAPAGVQGADTAIGGASGGAAPAGVTPKSTVVQDPSWLAAKAAHRIRLTVEGAIPVAADAPVTALPVARRLATTDTGLFVEPHGTGIDDRSVAYTDRNYWNFCAPGAAAVAVYYFGSARVTGRAAAYYVEPIGPYRLRTYWASADTVSGYATKGRSYLMYMAEQVAVPTWVVPGLDIFTSYPTPGATNPDTRDALNWEVSGHAAGWASWYYVVQPVGGARWSEAQLHADIAWDIGNDGRAVVAAVNTAYLPNWSRSIGHSIAIVGYDDTAKTYTYLDTCGRACNGSATSRNGGIYTVSQRSLYLAIGTWGTGYVW